MVDMLLVARAQMTEHLKAHLDSKLVDYLAWQQIRDSPEQKTLVLTSKAHAWQAMLETVKILGIPHVRIPVVNGTHITKPVVVMVTHPSSQQLNDQEVYSLAIWIDRDAHFLLTTDPTLVVRWNSSHGQAKMLYQPGSESRWYLTERTDRRTSLNMEIVEFTQENYSDSSSPDSLSPPESRASWACPDTPPPRMASAIGPSGSSVDPSSDENGQMSLDPNPCHNVPSDDN